MSNSFPFYFRYWGKFGTEESSAGRAFHLLAFHSLDVAACGSALLSVRSSGVARMAAQLGWTERELQDTFVVLLALHDVGKFSRAFQRLVKHGRPELVPPAITRASDRHDTMGWELLAAFHQRGAVPVALDAADAGFWQTWLRVIAGHHGRPPKEEARRELRSLFLAEDEDAALLFMQNVFALLHPRPLPAVPTHATAALERLSWQLAGLATLADWVGSNSDWFPYRETPETLASYWPQAQQMAAHAVEQAGIRDCRVRAWTGPKTLFDFPRYSPLQQHIIDLPPLQPGPQLFLLEDVTGAGKTEAALLLAHRMMADGQAHGIYFALPTTATANQLYERVLHVYHRLYEPGEAPNLVLSHGADRLVERFQQTILHDGDLPPERSLHGVQQEPGNGSAQCAAWLADNRKKSLMAEVGVGTVDQALLGTLPVRHQSLRMLGLSGKVLIVDEVHAYDAYTGGLLEALVEAQTMAGGSTILLSATVPANLRGKLIDAYRRGTGSGKKLSVPGDPRYPLITHMGPQLVVDAQSCGTRPELQRQVGIVTLATEEDALSLVLRLAAQGKAVCWVRNTVDDARQAYEAIKRELPADRVTLFHARFAMGHRLDIEKTVLDRFGKQSNAAARLGQVLIATQVVEQSLDLDFDEMISDLAPIDLVIQRAGRLHRHARTVAGDHSTKDERPAPVLHLLAPPFQEDPPADWYANVFPTAQFVYPHVGQLWLTLRALLAAGYIASPGNEDDPGSVRALVEAVYRDGALSTDVLEKASKEAVAENQVQRSLSGFNRLKLHLGYGLGSSDHWHERVDTPTRLGDDTRTVYLAEEIVGQLKPLVPGGRFPWEQSAVNLRATTINGLSEAWQQRFALLLTDLRGRVKLLADPETIVLPLVRDGDDWIGQVQGKGGDAKVRYSRLSGFGTVE